jgi:hypothetical protein
MPWQEVSMSDARLEFARLTLQEAGTGGSCAGGSGFTSMRVTNGCRAGLRGSAI